MSDLIITKEDLDEQGNYTGTTGNVNCDDSIIIEGNLGTVRFAANVTAMGHIESRAGSGISAGEGISAGSGISAGWGIRAGLSVSCSAVLSFGVALFAGACVWKRTTEDERTITCKRLEPRDGATVEYGILKLLVE